MLTHHILMINVKAGFEVDDQHLFHPILLLTLLTSFLQILFLQTF